MNFEQYLKQELEKDVDLRDEFNALQPKYEIIRKLIEARLEYGLTQKELAKKCGLKQSNISRLESGKANPTIKFLQKIANALNMDLFIEFRKKTYYSESVSIFENALPTRTIFGITYPIGSTNSNSNVSEVLEHKLIKAGR